MRAVGHTGKSHLPIGIGAHAAIIPCWTSSASVHPAAMNASYVVPFAAGSMTRTGAAGGAGGIGGGAGGTAATGTAAAPTGGVRNAGCG